MIFCSVFGKGVKLRNFRFLEMGRNTVFYSTRSKYVKSSQNGSELQDKKVCPKAKVSSELSLLSSYTIFVKGTLGGIQKVCHRPRGGGGSSKIVTNSDRGGRGVKPNGDVTVYQFQRKM